MNVHLAENLPKVLSPELAATIIQSSSFVNDGLPEEFKEVAIQVYVDAIQLIWFVFTPMSALGLLASCFVKHYSVRKQKQMKGEILPDEVVTVDVEPTTAKDTLTEKVVKD